ncbi:hypothetical protein FGIG_01606 [Fasciola gigantica]|uniref:Uncharacterized protein n=1 Tax=Fasciola gigantica TaxID=46835 RepID=A0A504YNT2_FASGI|nr:hypothetical protein FGIG_01606 [Fasciola gigantica]
MGINHSPSSVLDSRSKNAFRDFHRQLRAALDGVTNWTERLPVVLLRFLKPVKVNIRHTPAEMVYGMDVQIRDTVLHLDSSSATTNQSDYVGRLKTLMRPGY